MNRTFRFVLLALIAVGLSACVTTSDKRSDLIALFKEQVRACYALPKSALGKEPAVLEVRLNVDGSLAQAPKVLNGAPDSAQAKAAVRAVRRCVPFHIPADIAPRYPQWKVMRIAFETR